MVKPSEELNQQLEVLAPTIIFFGLPEKKQVAILPILEEKRKYNFPDGDLVTSDALEVLINIYKSCLNSIFIYFTIMFDEMGDEEIKHLVSIVEHLLKVVHAISENQFEPMDDLRRLDTSEYGSLRLLSLSLQQELNINLEINTKSIKTCLAYWIHP